MIECESGIEHVVRCSKFSESVCHILTYTTSPEVCSTLFDMLKTCSESPAMVTHLAKGMDYVRRTVLMQCVVLYTNSCDMI